MLSRCLLWFDVDFQVWAQFNYVLCIVISIVCFPSQHTRIALPVPMFHCFGMVLGSLTTVIHGSTVIMPSAGFDPFAALQAAEDER